MLQSAETLSATIERELLAAVGGGDPHAPVQDTPLPSRCTLLVVPRPLLQHWAEQIAWHLTSHALDGEVLIDGETEHGPLGARHSAER